MDEATHEALLLGKVLGVGIVGRLVWLVLYQRGGQGQDVVHLKETREGERSFHLVYFSTNFLPALNHSDEVMGQRRVE